MEQRSLDVLGGEGQVGVGADVGGVVAAELEVDPDEAAGGGALDRPPALHRAGEADEVDPRVSDHPAHVVVGGVHVAEDACGQARLLGGLGQALRAQRGLIRVLEQHVPGHKAGTGVHGGQVGVVPGAEHQHRAPGLAPDEALEAVLGLRDHVRQRGLREADHVARALLEAADLAGPEADGAPHLPGELFSVLVCPGDEGIDHGGDARDPLGERRRGARADAAAAGAASMAWASPGADGARPFDRRGDDGSHSSAGTLLGAVAEQRRANHCPVASPRIGRCAAPPRRDTRCMSRPSNSSARPSASPS